MLELQNNRLSFRFPEVHPNAALTITLHRTLRIPDDGKKYPLPPSLGAFPVRHIDDFKDRVPDNWRTHGGVMLPLYQSEAMWIEFTSRVLRDRGAAYPFAIKVAAGKRSAVTGKPWSKDLREGDYCVSPKQPWIDGYVVENGVIRQFVAMPLGMGLTAEAQLAGEERFGGVQIEVYPMKYDAFDRRFPVLPPQPLQDPHSFLRGMGGWSGRSGHETLYTTCSVESHTKGLVGSAVIMNTTSSGPKRHPKAMRRASLSVPAPDMGLGAGGQMAQQIFADEFGLEDWDSAHTSRVFCHLANSMAWRSITAQDPPAPPLTAADYARHGMPWFDFYEDAQTLSGTKKRKGLKSVLEVAAEKGLMGVLPENESAKPKHVKKLARPGVRDGVWK